MMALFLVCLMKKCEQTRRVSYSASIFFLKTSISSNFFCFQITGYKLRSDLEVGQIMLFQHSGSGMKQNLATAS